VGRPSRSDFKFRDVPESVLGDLHFTTHYDPWPLLFLIYVRIRGESGPIPRTRPPTLQLGRRVRREYPLHTYSAGRLRRLAPRGATQRECSRNWKRRRISKDPDARHLLRPHPVKRSNLRAKATDWTSLNSTRPKRSLVSPDDVRRRGTFNATPRLRDDTTPSLSSSGLTTRSTSKFKKLFANFVSHLRHRWTTGA
jgi:hypothetical protein